MHGRTAQGATKQLDELDQPMAGVEEETAEGLELAGSKIEPQEIAHRVQRCERYAASESVCDVHPSSGNDFIDAGRDRAGPALSRPKARAQALTARTAWQNATRGKPAPAKLSVDVFVP